MEKIQTITKTTSDDWLFDFEYANHPAIVKRAAILQNVIAVVFTPDDGVLIKGTPTFNGTRVQIRLSAGANKTLYLGKATAYTDKGDTVIAFGKLLVEDPD